MRQIKGSPVEVELKSDLRGQIRRLATFLEKTVTDQEVSMLDEVGSVASLALLLFVSRMSALRPKMAANDAVSDWASGARQQAPNRF